LLNNFSEKTSFIWSVADLLRGPYRPNQYKDVMLPLTVLRRLDCVLTPTKARVLDLSNQLLADGRLKNIDPILVKETGVPFYNTSRFTFERLKADPNHIAANLTNFIQGFSPRAREIVEMFGFQEQIAKLEQNNRLYQVVAKFCDIDLHPDQVSNIEMGYIFEDLIRRFNEASNEEAGDHFTPREVIRLMVDLIFLPDGDTLTKLGIVKTLYDPACGTGGMLSVSEDYLRNLNRDGNLVVFGQDYNAQAYAICGSDMLIKGQDIDHIAFGDSFTADKFPHEKFDYMLANPPFGVEWKPQEDVIRREADELGYNGRFGAGLPRINDGSFLFLQHMLSKMKDPNEGGTRLAIVFNGSPLFTGGAGSGESEIRRWIIENDWLEGIVALPEQLFYNTGIATYLWIVTNRKEAHRKGKVQLVDATSYYQKMRKSLGNKRHEIAEEQRAAITRLYGEFRTGEHVRIFDNEDFGYSRITVERPLKLNFAVTDERLEQLKQTRQFEGLAQSKKRKGPELDYEIRQGQALQQSIIAALDELRHVAVVKNRDKFESLMEAALRRAGVKVSATVKKAILMAMSARDETADICADARGNPEPDPELREYENVPLKEDIDEYMQREVLPHVPDAWIDKDKTKVGYEVSFNRYFYQYRAPRSLDGIAQELRGVEQEIAELLSGLTK
jgi:type I restriction enzyme M protein